MCQGKASFYSHPGTGQVSDEAAQRACPWEGPMGRGQQVASIYLDYSEVESSSHFNDNGCEQSSEVGSGMQCYFFFLTSNISSLTSSFISEEKFCACWTNRVQKEETI
jgi:hypothetical protein